METLHIGSGRHHFGQDFYHKVTQEYDKRFSGWKGTDGGTCNTCQDEITRMLLTGRNEDEQKDIYDGIMRWTSSSSGDKDRGAPSTKRSGTVDTVTPSSVSRSASSVFYCCTLLLNATTVVPYILF